MGQQFRAAALYLKSDLNIGDSFIKYDTAYTQNDLHPAERSIIPIKTIYTIIEKNVNRTVNNINYSDVIHISSSSSSVFFAQGQFINSSDLLLCKKYWANRKLPIFHINYILSFDQHFHTILVTSDIK